MDINSAGLYIRRLLSYVSSLSEDRPTMYAPSKVKLQEIADTCNQVVSIVSELLQTEVLQQDSSEFHGTDTEVSSAVQKMHNTIEGLQSFTDSVKPLEVSTETKLKSKIVAEYASSISTLESVSSGVEYADTCSKLLSTWFKARILHRSPKASFRYNVMSFPSWISSLVLAFGKSLHQGTCELFIESFNTWIEKVLDADQDVKYAVPFEVHRILKDPTAEDATLESVVLWDILMVHGLHSLSKLDRAALAEDLVYNRVADLNPSILDNYVYYQDYPDILDRLGWKHDSIERGE